VSIRFVEYTFMNSIRFVRIHLVSIRFVEYKFREYTFCKCIVKNCLISSMFNTSVGAGATSCYGVF
jgi:hypothetical protein